MRHDFDDQIQVRYVHTSKQHFDTWVSGEEALKRLKSDQKEADLRKLRALDWDYLKTFIGQLPEKSRQRLNDELHLLAADRTDEFMGGTKIGDSLVEAIRGKVNPNDSTISEKQRWLILLFDEAFRKIVLELAWIQLEGSFSDNAIHQEPDDWI